MAPLLLRSFNSLVLLVIVDSANPSFFIHQAYSMSLPLICVRVVAPAACFWIRGSTSAKFFEPSAKATQTWRLEDGLKRL